MVSAIRPFLPSSCLAVHVDAAASRVALTLDTHIFAPFIESNTRRVAEVKAEAPAAAAASFNTRVERAMRVAAPDTAEGGGSTEDRSRSSADGSVAGVMRAGDDRNNRNGRNDADTGASAPLPMLSPGGLDAVLLQASKETEAELEATLRMCVSSEDMADIAASVAAQNASSGVSFHTRNRHAIDVAVGEVKV